MAPTWRLALYISLLLLGVMAQDERPISPDSEEKLVQSVISMMEKLVKAADSDLDPCTRFAAQTAFKCLPVGAKHSHAFSLLTKYFSPDGPAPNLPDLDKELLPAFTTDLSGVCRASFSTVDCVTKILCMAPNCSASQATKYIDLAVKEMKGAFESQDACANWASSVDLASLGCGSVGAFRVGNEKCNQAIDKKVIQSCQIEAKKSVKPGQVDPCLGAYYLVSCLTRAKCEKCEPKLKGFYQAEGQIEVDSEYGEKKECAGFMAPSAVKCSDSGDRKTSMMTPSTLEHEDTVTTVASSSKTILVIVVVFEVLLILALGVGIFCCWRKNNQADGEMSVEGSKKSVTAWKSKSKLSNKSIQ